MSAPNHDDVLNDALDALTEGRYEECLRALEHLDPERGERWIVATEAYTELGEWERAEKTLAQAAQLKGPADSDVAWAEGRLRLVRWDLPGAHQAFERLNPEDEGAPYFENMALLADLHGDFQEADRLLERCNELDPDNYPVPPRLTPDEFEQVVEQAVKGLPAEFQTIFERAVVIVDPMPTREIVGAPESGHPPDILGLFSGLSQEEASSFDSGDLPPSIFLFQRNLERLCRNQQQLKKEIRVTLYHELGHALGFDEDGVEDMGLG